MKSFAFGIISSIALISTGCVSTTSLGTVASERKQLMIIPESAWNKISNRSYNKFEKKAKTKSLYLEDPRLNQILARLIPHANQYLREGRQPIQWRINGVLSSKPNAQSFQSGQIVVNSAVYMFENLSDDELATLIAHEMAHIIRNHSREKASRFAAMNLGLMGVTMGTGAAIGLASGLSGNQTNMSHRRHLEEEADLIGLDLMVRAGYNHNAALSFWDKFEANLNKRKMNKDQSTLFASHPSNDQRKAFLTEQVMQIEMYQKDVNLTALR